MLVCVCSMWHQLLSLWSSSCKYLVFVSRLTPQSALQSLNYPVSGSQTIVVLTCDNRKSIINNKNNISLSFIIHKNQMHFTSIFMDRWITVKMLCKKGFMFPRYIYITAFYFFLLPASLHYTAGAVNCGGTSQPMGSQTRRARPMACLLVSAVVRSVCFAVSQH